MVVLLHGQGVQVAGHDVVEGELVGNTRQVSLIARQRILVVGQARTEVELHGEGVVPEALVDRQQRIGIEVAVARRVVEVVSVFRSEEQVRRSRDLARVVHHHVVRAHAAREAQPVEQVPFQRRMERIAVRGILEDLAVDHPVGILDAVDEFQAPELLAVTQIRVVALVDLIFPDIVPAREEVDADERVVVDTLNQRVAAVLLHVGGTQVERQFVLDQFGRVAHREVVTVVDVVRDDAPRIDRCSREIGLVALRTARDADGIGLVESRLEEVLRIVGRGSGEFLTPAHRRRVDIRAVGILELRHHERRREGRAVRVVHPHAPLLAAFGRDQDHAVGALRSVQRGSRSTRQHRHRLDILGVDAGYTLVIAAVGRLVDALGLLRTQARQRNTVDHVEGVVVAVERFDATHHHAGRTAGSRGAGIDLQTGDLARERIHEVGILDRVDDRAGDLLHVVGQGLLLTLDTEGRHHHGVEDLVVLAHDDFERRDRARHRNLLFRIADQRDFEHVARLGLRQGEVAVEIDGHADRRSLKEHRGTDQCHALLILHRTADAALRGAGRCLRLARQYDMLVPKGISDVEVGEQPVQDPSERLVTGDDGHFPFSIDIGGIVNERIVRLLLNSLEDRDDRNVPKIEGHMRGRLRHLCRCPKGKARQ